jgi:hypothetical protein
MPRRPPSRTRLLLASCLASGLALGCVDLTSPPELRPCVEGKCDAMEPLRLDGAVANAGRGGQPGQGGLGGHAGTGARDSGLAGDAASADQRAEDVPAIGPRDTGSDAAALDRGPGAAVDLQAERDPLSPADAAADATEVAKAGDAPASIDDAGSGDTSGAVDARQDEPAPDAPQDPDAMLDATAPSLDLAADLEADAEADVAPDAPADLAVDAPADLPPDLAQDLPPDTVGTLPIGSACGAAGQCATGLCVDGRCCGSSCAGVCQACDLPGLEGTCTPVPEGQDPANECPIDAVATCGRDGVCSGQGACRLHLAVTECAPAGCSNATVTSPRFCDGAGTCRPPSTSTACAPYACGAGLTCGISCTSDAGCAAGNICVDSACVPATGAFLRGRFEPATGTYDLTALANMDWMHFGHDPGGAYVNRRAAPASGMQHLAMALVGATSFNRYNDRPLRFSWTDGAPTAMVSQTPWGIYADGMSNGFRITANAAATAARTLRIVVGVWQGRGKLVARLTDDSAPLYSEATLSAANTGQDRAYTIAYRAGTTGQSLIVEWTMDAIVAGQPGNTTLQAVTLSQ